MSVPFNFRDAFPEFKFSQIFSSQSDRIPFVRHTWTVNPQNPLRMLFIQFVERGGSLADSQPLPKECAAAIYVALSSLNFPPFETYRVAVHSGE